MADWVWEIVETFDKGGAVVGDGSLAVQGNRLWAHVMSSIYHSDDGDVYTEDPLWDKGTPEEICTYLFSLYAIVNTSPGFELWKRGNTDWILVGQNATGTAHSMWANDEALMICGNYTDALLVQHLRIWRYDGSLTEDFADDPPYYLAEDVCYSRHDGNWYVAVVGQSGGGANSILRRVSAGNWVADSTMDAWGSEGYRSFGVHTTGVYVMHEDDPGGPANVRVIRKQVDGIWEYIADEHDPFSTLYSHLTFYGWYGGGHVVTDTSYGRGLPAFNQVGSIRKWDRPTETWVYVGTAGDVGYHRPNDWEEFRGGLYCAADRKTWANGNTDYYDILRVMPYVGTGIPPYNRGDCKALVCDHEYGDTLYIGLRDENQHPFIIWLNWDFEDFWLGYEASSGSAVGVQTVETRDECFGFGQFGVDKQVVLSEDKLLTWDESQGEFDSDEVTTLHYHPQNGDDLAATRRLSQDLIQTLIQRSPWSHVIDTPFVARSQLRVQDDIWIGSDTSDDIPVRMYNETSGSWTPKSTGLPTTVAINDLELGF